MIFPTLKTEDVVQLNDKTRLDGTGSYLSPDESAITLIEIEPEASAGYFDVTTNKYLDWQYSTAGLKAATIRITTDSTPTSYAAGITAISVDDDNLFSADTDLVDYEDDILNYIRSGRNSFLDKHRAAQRIILNDLDSNKYWKEDGSRYEAADIVDIQEFKQWSIFLTLKIIFRTLSNAKDDIFDTKSHTYNGRATSAKKRATFRLDFDGDGEISEDTEKISNQVTYLIKGM